MATENTDMRGLLGEKKGELGKESQLLEKRLEKQQQRFKRLMMENEELRQTLIAEMDRADENLQDLEKQSRRTPSAGLGMS